MSEIALIGKKLGMTNIFEGNSIVPVTVIKILPNVVLGSREYGTKSCIILAGNGDVSDKKVNKPQRSWFLKKEIKPKCSVKEFVVHSSIKVKPGTTMSVGDYLNDSVIDVRSMSIGKGFQGAMKRYGFGGLSASHGVSLTHRSLGSTGNRTLPGRVFKGKKMAGHMGNKMVCVQNLKVCKVDSDNNIIAVRGSVPGKENAVVYITNAVKRYIENDSVLNGVVCEG